MTTPTNPLSDKSPDKIIPNKALEPDQVIKGQPNTNFESYMNKGTPPQGGGGPTQGTGSTTTPMDLAKTPSMQMAGPSINSLTATAKNGQDTLGTVEKQLQSPNLKLKRSQTHLLRNKLTDANANLNAAGAKLGLPPSEIKSSGNGGSVDRFLSYINAGQDQFTSIQKKLQEMASSGEPLNPGDMMLLQTKLAVAQQEIEYSSTLLAKVIDSMKQVMSIQL